MSAWGKLLDEYLAGVDQNHDGLLSKQELMDYLDVMKKQHYPVDYEKFEIIFKKCDSNNNGKLHKAELMSFIKQFN